MGTAATCDPSAFDSPELGRIAANPFSRGLPEPKAGAVFKGREDTAPEEKGDTLVTATMLANPAVSREASRARGSRDACFTDDAPLVDGSRASGRARPRKCPRVEPAFKASRSPVGDQSGGISAPIASKRIRTTVVRGWPEGRNSNRLK